MGENAVIVKLDAPKDQQEVIKVVQFNDEFESDNDENYEDTDSEEFANASGKFRKKRTAKKVARQEEKTIRRSAKTGQKLAKHAGKQSVKQFKRGGRQEARIGRRGTRRSGRQDIRDDQQGRRQGRKNYRLEQEQGRENYALEQQLMRDEMMPDVEDQEQLMDDQLMDDQSMDYGYDDQESLDQNEYDYDYQDDNSYPEDNFEQDFDYEDDGYYPEDDYSGYDENDGMYYFQGAPEFQCLNGENKGEIVALAVDKPLLDIAKKIEWHYDKMRREQPAENQRKMHVDRITELESEFSNFCACGNSSADGGVDPMVQKRRLEKVKLARLAARDIRTGRSKAHGGKLRAQFTKVNARLNPDFAANEIRIPAESSETSSFTGYGNEMSNASGSGKKKIVIPWKAIGIGAAAGLAVYGVYKFYMKSKK